MVSKVSMLIVSKSNKISDMWFQSDHITAFRVIWDNGGLCELAQWTIMKKYYTKNLYMKFFLDRPSLNFLPETVVGRKTFESCPFNLKARPTYAPDTIVLGPSIVGLFYDFNSNQLFSDSYGLPLTSLLIQIMHRVFKFTKYFQRYFRSSKGMQWR